MIQIGEAAQQYFRKLIAQQGIEGLGIRIRVVQPGTPAADCRLEFCEPVDVAEDDWVVECEGFNLYVAEASVRWLDAASMDFETTPTGGQLTIRAPKIKGEAPGADASLVERVRYVIDSEINPQIAAHKGRVSLESVSADGEVVLRFGGGCHGCGMAAVTLKEGIEKTLMARVPGVRAVRDVTDHSTGQAPYIPRGA